MPFDMEGQPKKKIVMIEAGVPTALFYDFRSAQKYGKEPTGGFPMNIFMAEGDATVEDMIKNTKRGILVTRFHYTNLVHPTKTVLTGMARDGTFWIENGQIAYPVKNLRFTQSILDALASATAIGRERKLVDVGWACVPALKLERFEFSGTTEF